MAKVEQTPIKTWRIDSPSDITTDDLKWLTKICFRIHYESNEVPVKLDYRGSQYTIQSRSPVLKCVTNNAKNETLLKLKFGDRLILESYVNVSSASLSHLYV